MSILALTSDALIGTPATGNIEYSGQFYGTDSNASRAQMQRITQGTAVASTSGTSIDFVSILSWVKRITVMFSGVSTNSTSNYLIQLGTGSTTFTTSGYVSSCRTAVNTSGFLIVDGPTAASLVSGAITLTNFSGNTWVSSGVLQISGGGAYYSSGVIALAAQLTAVRITSVTPDTFDAGSINILYEG